MTDNPQTDGTNDLNQIQEYQKLVLQYEAVDEEIDALLARHNGSTEKMSDSDYEHYRELANHRDYIYNQMKTLERQILLDDEG